ncbi:MAG: tRNA (guanine(10)-N(2))-dimethyltransferase, partial [Methanothermobacter sp.]|nr:tRNA (guanine(10)-N(2))-dimethyltransferase [Methanothermobacter sp.]
NIGFILHCFKCLHHEHMKGFVPLKQECPHCGAEMEAAGPLWVGDIQDSRFIGEMIGEVENKKLNTATDVLKLLKACLGEAGMPPGFYDIHEVCSKLGRSAPPLRDVMDGLEKAGFRVSRTHIRPTGIKTDATIRDIEEVLEGFSV